MPQGRRKTPFGGKAKKAQLQEKREKKQEKSQFGDDSRIPFTKGLDNEESDKSDKIVAKCDKDKLELLMDLPTSHLQSTQTCSNSAAKKPIVGPFSFALVASPIIFIPFSEPFLRKNCASFLISDGLMAISLN